MGKYISIPIINERIRVFKSVSIDTVIITPAANAKAEVIIFWFFLFVKKIIIPPSKVDSPANVEQIKENSTLFIEPPKLMYEKRKKDMLYFLYFNISCFCSFDTR